MSIQDYFVGAVAVLMGSLSLIGAVMNFEWYYNLNKARRLESWLGRRGVRVVYALLGMSLIALGIAIACGFAPNKSTAQRKLKPISPQDPGLETAFAIS